MKENIRSIINEHYLAVILAIVVGIISVAPQFYFAFFSGDYLGLHMFGTDAEYHYLARINEVYNGHPALGNVFLEDKGKPYTQPGLGEIIVAGLGKTLRLRAADMNVASKFLFPTIVFALFYAFTYKLFASKKIAILAACVSFFGMPLLNPNALRHLIELVSFPANPSAYFLANTKFLEYTRPIIPQISALFLFGSLYALFELLNQKDRAGAKKWLILAGVALGLSVYVSIYVWSFLVLFAFLHLLYALYAKNNKSAASLFWALVMHGVVSVPYWINFIQARMHPAYADTAMRFGIVEGREPVFSIWLAVALVVAIFFWPKRYAYARKFFVFMTIATWIALNQQIITGKILQYGHYHWYVTKPLLISMLLAMLFVYCLERFVRSDKVVLFVAAVAVAGLFFAGLLTQVHSYKNNYVRSINRQRYSDVILYLNKQYTVPLTIWSDNGDLATVLAGYTAHNVPNSSFAAYYLEKRDYFIKRLFLEYRLRGIGPGEIRGVLDGEKEHVSGSIFVMYYREKLGDSALLPKEFLSELEDGYKSFYGLSFSDIFKDFQIDLIVWDSKVNPNLIYEDISILRKTARVEDGFVIYRLEI